MYEASEQHKETSQAYLQRDYRDSLKIFQYVIARNPFDNPKELMSIDTVEIAIANQCVDIQLRIIPLRRKTWQ